MTYGVFFHIRFCCGWKLYSIYLLRCGWSCFLRGVFGLPHRYSWHIWEEKVVCYSSFLLIVGTLLLPPLISITDYSPCSKRTQKDRCVNMPSIVSQIYPHVFWEDRICDPFLHETCETFLVRRRSGLYWIRPSLLLAGPAAMAAGCF